MNQTIRQPDNILKTDTLEQETVKHCTPKIPPLHCLPKDASVRARRKKIKKGIQRPRKLRDSLKDGMFDSLMESFHDSLNVQINDWLSKPWIIKKSPLIKLKVKLINQ